MTSWKSVLIALVYAVFFLLIRLVADMDAVIISGISILIAQGMTTKHRSI